MAYHSYFVKTGRPLVVGSRSRANTYPGLECPDRISFSLAHGPTPAAGEIDFEDFQGIGRAGNEAYLQIGMNTFWGILVKRERSVRVDSGYTVKFTLADNRDRLFDDLVFAQFNMITGDSQMHHTFPIHWEQQIQTIIRAEDKTDFKNLVRDPNNVRRVNIDLGDCTRPFSSAELLDWFASYFNFSWDATPIALNFLKAARPLNMDWNSGTPVAQAIQDILDFSELQFTVYGNLNLFISVTGYTENQFQYELLTSDEALCDIGSGFSQTNLGEELNTKGRRLVLTGGQNKYQFVYPGLPGWNPNWNYWLTFNGYELALILQANGLTMLNKIKELPEALHDYGIWQGSSRMEMTIYDYVNQIPFRVYVVDMSKVLDDQFNIAHTDPQEINRRFQFNPNGSLKLTPGGKFNWNLIGADPRIIHLNTNLFSRFPISDTLITHSGDLAFTDDPDHTLTSRQFIAWANTRVAMRRDQVDPWDMVNQTIRIDEGVNLEIEEIVHKTQCRRLWKINAIFATPRVIILKKEQIYLGEGKFGTIDETLPERYRDNFPYEIIPDRPYFAISTDREIYNKAFGEPSRRGNPTRYRQREKTINVPNLRRGFVQGQQVYMMMANLNTRVDELGRIVKGVNGQPIQAFSAFTADEISPAIAAQTLRHEAVTTAGNITFEDAAGFRPDGLITSVADEWTDGGGIQETVNFTNDHNHEFRQVVLDVRAIERGAADNESNATRRELIRRATEILKNPQPQRAAQLPEEHGASNNNLPQSPMTRIKTVGKGDTVVATVDYSADDLPTLDTGEAVLLG